MTDKELLELAAKAEGISTVIWNDGTEPYSSGEGFIQINNHIWNPLTDDGDALRLAGKLGICLIFLFSSLEGGYKHGVSARCMEVECEEWGNDISAATRRAIVRAAAEIGKEVLNG